MNFYFFQKLNPGTSRYKATLSDTYTAVCVTSKEIERHEKNDFSNECTGVGFKPGAVPCFRDGC
ncbi:hypothetical protein CRX67_19960 [Enterobacteriaceae bacterium A-F18]|nr:hypothetical protein C2U55_10115 [Enterobacteriaceae bacterium ENNIH3]AUV10411.1 hypothetical protein C2U52_02595 [Enterobacteriaceae bacterium ENNIH2]PTA89131.1 hypothetical protein C9415_24045 [Kluyvera sp. Nf5]PWF54422.1 hypothetical protein BHT19_0014715 [[Kluyvera] intestini]QIH66718.1 hypothetical protein CRX67_19960 [Enterobacteriaceae bacterium A-F18]